MPTYQYSCTECGHFLEAVQKFTDDALTTCPECGGRLRKVFNAVGVVFKGSGFYRTDSRNGSTPAPAEGTNGNGTKGSGKPEPAAASSGTSSPSSGSATSTTASASSGSSSASSD